MLLILRLLIVINNLFLGMWWDGSWHSLNTVAMFTGWGNCSLLNAKLYMKKDCIRWTWWLTCFETVNIRLIGASAGWWRGEWCAFINDLGGAGESIYGAWIVDIVCIHWITEHRVEELEPASHREQQISIGKWKVSLLIWCSVLQWC